MRIAGNGVGCDQNGVAIRRALGRRLDADVAVGTGLVLDIDLLAEGARQVLADQPRRDIGRAARRKRHDEPDRLRWIRLGVGAGERGSGRKGRERSAGCPDRSSLILLVPAGGPRPGR